MMDTKLNILFFLLKNAKQNRRHFINCNDCEAANMELCFATKRYIYFSGIKYKNNTFED